MGLPKKQPAEFNLWDGLIKPIDWYFGDAGRRAFESAYKNADEMKRAMDESNWISITFNVCYQSSKKPLLEKKNWLIKYFYEYVLSRYSTKMSFNEHTLVLITKTACFLLDNGTPPIFTYTDCFDEGKNPTLYFLSHVKELLPDGYSEVTYPILRDIIHYIFNAFTVCNHDASRESWMYEKTIYVDDRGKPNKYDFTVKKLPKLAERPECLFK